MDFFFHIFRSEFVHNMLHIILSFLFFTEQHMRFRRSPQEEAALGPPLRYAPIAPSYDQYEADQALAGSTAYAKHPKGRVGPVYTFVKTDPKANFKWGVRHVAGVQYGK